MPAPTQWTLILPVKQTAIAKSRLTGISAPVRRRLALAFACDAADAALGCPLITEVVAVTNDERAGCELAALGVLVVPDAPDAGLNAALAWAAADVRRREPAANLAVMSADLPAVRAADLGIALAAAPQRRWFLADEAGDGTTMLGAPAPFDLLPAFGADSSAAHRASGAVQLPTFDVPRLRVDVDTAEDLRAAVRLGVGAATARVLADSPATI